ncbi:MAG: CDP-alcohol phosphatidyltransferase family protein [Firmicutes bacterium]|nr:CDP-alcohol phosphatidyltransferase family protein [Bacillota bacterium]
MIDTKLRGVFQPLFNGLARGLIKLKLSSNTISLAAFGVGLGASLSIAMGHLVPALILLWLSGLLDVLDGSVARLTATASPLGAYLDLIFDRMVESAVILACFFLLPQYALAYLLFFVAVLFNFTTFIVAGALFKNNSSKSMHYDIGIAERTETFIVFTLMLLFQPFAGLILMIFNGLIFLTGGLRFLRIIRSAADDFS